jgi:hypothetical protein
MKGFVFVASEGLGSDADLRRWVELGLLGAASSQTPRARRKGTRASK